MRILHISTRLILGGSQENTILSCEEQSRRGHDVHLAFGPIYGPEGSLLERVQKFRTADGRAITTHVIPHMVREIRPNADVRAYRELRRLIRELKPDIVHTHSSKAGILGRLAARHEFERDVAMDPAPPMGPVWMCGIVHTVHGPPFMPLDGGSLRRTKTRVLNCVYTIAERHAARNCQAIVSVADAMTRQFLQRGIGKPDQYTTVRSGMEVDAFLNAVPGESRDEARRGLNLAPDDFVIGTIARLAEHKGHDDILDALAEDLKKHPNWKLLWVGNGWWRERLVAKARAMGLVVVDCADGRGTRSNAQRTTLNAQSSGGATASGQVFLVGLVPPERIPGLTRAMDVLAHPSTREGLPRTVPQALLCGVCPVAYDVDGTGEACIEMETGRLVPAGDTGRLRDVVRWCFENPARRQALAEVGRVMCREQFSVQAMVDGLDRVYAQALQRART